MNSPEEDITKTIAELQKVQAKIRSSRSVTVIIVIAIVVGCTLLVWQAVNRLTQEGAPQDEFARELAAGLRTTVLPQVQSIARQTATRMVPIVETELKKLNARAPEIADAARRELEALAKNVPERAEMILNTSFGGILKKRESRIRELYPEVTEAKVSAFIKNLGLVSEERTADLVETEFAGHIAGLNKIHENLHQIFLSEAEATSQEVPNWEMALLFFDVIREEVRPLETMPPVKP